MLSICRSRASGEISGDPFDAVRHVVNKNLERPISASEVQMLLRMLGVDTVLADRRRAKRQKHNAGVARLQELGTFCADALHPRLVELYSAEEPLARPLELLREFAPSQALPYFLHAADRVIGVPHGDGVALRTRAGGVSGAAAGRASGPRL